MMDARTFQWLASALARGIAWVLVGKLGIEAAVADGLAARAAPALIALALVGVSLISSVRSRRKLLDADPPADAKDRP